MTSTRFETAVNRNFAELQKVLLIRETLLGIEQLRYTGKVFIRVINDALHNDYMSHSIKLFEQGSQAASFWYIYRSDARQIDLHARRTGYSLTTLQTVSDKLKAIRNGTHFHIDSSGVLDPGVIWSDAALTGKELAAAIDFAWGALCEVQSAKGGEIPSLLDYTAADALNALQRIEGTASSSAV